MSKKKTHKEFLTQFFSNNPYHESIEILGQYKGTNTKIKCHCKVCDTFWEDIPKKLIKGKGCPFCAIKRRAKKKTYTHEKFLDEFYIRNKYSSHIDIISKYEKNYLPIKCRCTIHNYEWETTPTKLLSGYGCPVCAHRSVVKGFNDLRTTRPDLVSLLINESDADTYSVNSHNKIWVKCPDCNKLKFIAISNLTNFGVCCDNCRDNITYPNKYGRVFLKQLPIKNILTEYSPDWAGKLRYDFYFEYNNQKFIIEMDGGLGHGRRGYGKEKIDIEGLKRDKQKDILADKHNITLIRIDCQKSNSDYISRNILKSKLAEIFDLSKIDWDECDEFSQSNLVKAVCDYYKTHNNITKNELSQIFDLCVPTITKYLKRGHKFGWIVYDTDRDIIKGIEKRTNDNYSSLIDVYKDGVYINRYRSLYQSITAIKNIFNIQISYSRARTCSLKNIEYKGFLFQKVGRQGDVNE